MLSEVSGVRSARPLLASINDEVSAVRDHAAEALHYLIPKLSKSRTSAIPTLLEATKSHDDLAVSTATALGDVRCREAAVPILIDLLSKDEKVASTATNALGKIGDVRAVKPLLARAIRELAFVWVHEISHVLREHASRNDDLNADSLRWKVSFRQACLNLFGE